MIQGLKHNEVKSKKYQGKRHIFGCNMVQHCDALNTRTIPDQIRSDCNYQHFLDQRIKKNGSFDLPWKLYIYIGYSLFTPKLLCLKIRLFVMCFLLQENHFFIWLFMICCEAFESPLAQISGSLPY